MRLEERVCGVGLEESSKADSLRSTAVYRVREIELCKKADYPLITRVKELQYPHLFVHCDDNPDSEDNSGVTTQDVGGDFEIAPDAGGVIDPPLDDDEDEAKSERVTPPEIPTTSEPIVKSEAQSTGNDTWVLKKYEITRIHRDPRDKLFSPLTCKDPPPIP